MHIMFHILLDYMQDPQYHVNRDLLQLRPVLESIKLFVLGKRILKGSSDPPWNLTQSLPTGKGLGGSCTSPVEPKR